MYLSTCRHSTALFAAIVLTLGLPTLTSAHHSRSSFDTSTLLEFSGVITEYSWRNPHTFATVVVEDDSGDRQELLFELNSVSVMSRQGWTRDTIQVGDQVTVFANPDNNHDKNLYLKTTHKIAWEKQRVQNGSSGYQKFLLPLYRHKPCQI